MMVDSRLSAFLHLSSLTTATVPTASRLQSPIMSTVSTAFDGHETTTTTTTAPSDDTKDFTKAAILRSWEPRIITYTEISEGRPGSNTAPSQTDDDVLNHQLGDHRQVTILGCTFGSTVKEFEPHPLPGDNFAQQLWISHSGTENRYRVEITRAEKGHWHGKQAHFIRLAVEHLGPLTDPLERLNVEVTVKAVQDPEAIKTSKSADAVLTSAARDASSTSGIAPSSDAMVWPPIGTRSVDRPIVTGGPTPPAQQPQGAVRIVAYAPERVFGIPVSVGNTSQLELELGLGAQASVVTGNASAKGTFGQDWRVDERYQGFDDADIKTEKTILNVYSVANPKYKEDIPKLHIGLVVLSYGQPFVLTATAKATPWNRRIFSIELVPRSSPAKFLADGPDLVPHGEKKIEVDFGSQQMTEMWKKLIPWPNEFGNVLVGLDGNPGTPA